MVLARQNLTQVSDAIEARYAHAEQAPIQQTRKGREHTAEDNGHTSGEDGLRQSGRPRREPTHDGAELGALEEGPVGRRRGERRHPNVRVSRAVSPHFVHDSPPLSYSGCGRLGPALLPLRKVELAASRVIGQQLPRRGATAARPPHLDKVRPVKARRVGPVFVPPPVALRLTVVANDVVLRKGDTDERARVAARAAIRRQDEKVARATSRSPRLGLARELAAAALGGDACAAVSAWQQRHHAGVGRAPVLHHKRARRQHVQDVGVGHVFGLGSNGARLGRSARRIEVDEPPGRPVVRHATGRVNVQPEGWTGWPACAAGRAKELERGGQRRGPHHRRCRTQRRRERIERGARLHVRSRRREGKQLKVLRRTTAYVHGLP
eukprot:scaffold23507_cov63-Phaeocystis_antarctica.AAC.5